MKRIAITGVTGLLGRNLLFEILRRNLDNLSEIEIYAIGRNKNEKSLKERLREIISTDGLHYIDIGHRRQEDVLEQALPRIIPIYCDFLKEGLGMSDGDQKKLRANPIDLFFHVGALTDFRSGKAVENALIQSNVEGTRRILKLASGLNINEFVYVGSAYSAGQKAGIIAPDYVDFNARFRNPYERTKLEAEVMVRDFFGKSGGRFKIFRPTTISGRLIEEEIGSVSKFDVFYSWGAFFLREKMKVAQNLNDIYRLVIDLPCRIYFHRNHGLNIVPADYAAKLMYAVCEDGTEDTSFHLATIKDVPHALYVSLILREINVTGYSFVEKEPVDKSKFELFYYKTVGRVFTPYVTGDVMTYDMSNTVSIRKRLGIEQFILDEKGFEKLIHYAKRNYFGLIETADAKKIPALDAGK